VHIVLVPGFGGFDALGQIEYYAGTTAAFQRWRAAGGSRERPVVLHYFGNLPTAGVSTRAARLHSYVAKRIARGDIQDEDSVALVGHSTGGLDIRQMLFAPAQPDLDLDGGAIDELRATAVPVAHSQILDTVSRVVFLSVPQYGTNIADWVRSHTLARRAVIEGLYRGVQGASVRPLARGISRLLDELAELTKNPDLLKAVEDALNETQPSQTAGPVWRAGAEEAGSQLRLWLQHMDHDFGVIDDLASFTDSPRGSTSPAHYSEHRRAEELAVWRDHGIETRSIATIARRGFTFDPRKPAKPFHLHDVSTWPTHERAADAGDMDISYVLAYRACAGGAFEVPSSVAAQCENIDGLNTTLLDVANLGPSGPRAGAGLAVWDNDGIVNTASMLWPDLSNTRLVAADHLDIVGHYVLRKTVPSPDASGRRYASVDALKSHTEFTQDAFDRVWKDVFDHCVS
jgi:hypothetical protein